MIFETLQGLKPTTPGKIKRKDKLKASYFFTFGHLKLSPIDSTTKQPLAFLIPFLS